MILTGVSYPSSLFFFCSEQYNLDYYLNFTRQLTELGIHVLAIKDMAGLLKPAAATLLVSLPIDADYRRRSTPASSPRKIKITSQAPLCATQAFE